MPRETEADRRARIAARVDAMSHPLRVAITTIAGQRPVSATEIADELREPVSKVRYQLRRLVDVGMVEVSTAKRRRGVIEQFYVCNEEAMVFSSEELELVPAAKRRKMAATFLKVTFREALNALAAGTIMAGEGSVTIRVPLRLDRKGWAELVQIHLDAFAQVQKLKADSAKRVAKGDEVFPITSVFLCFEYPSTSDPTA